ncbi:S-adenosyl-L-methionine-dependent methyltransferase, partial [Macrolepiota fuliginosa MF-IS2]
RLDLQHSIWTLVNPGLYIPDIAGKVETTIKSSSEPRILDVGCGSGIWPIQMAQRFPQAKVVGLDLTPLDPSRGLPPNFSFELHDLTNDLPGRYRYEQFDIIHCRTVCPHVPDPQGLINSMAMCLKPGGLLFVGDWKTSSYDEDKQELKPFTYNPSMTVEQNLENETKGSWHSGWYQALGLALTGASYLPSPRMIENSTRLKGLIVKDLWLPIGWDGGVENGKELGELVMRDFEVCVDLFSKHISTSL